jgi:hypothetical protein
MSLCVKVCLYLLYGPTWIVLSDLNYRFWPLPTYFLFRLYCFWMSDYSDFVFPFWIFHFRFQLVKQIWKRKWFGCFFWLFRTIFFPNRREAQCWDPILEKHNVGSVIIEISSLARPLLMSIASTTPTGQDANGTDPHFTMGIPHQEEFISRGNGYGKKLSTSGLRIWVWDRIIVPIFPHVPL